MTSSRSHLLISLAMGLGLLSSQAIAGDSRPWELHVTADCDARLTPALEQQAMRFATVAAEESLVGSSLLVRLDGKTCGRVDYGLADIASNRAVDGETIFHWASNTKMFLGVALLQLRDRGLISLDDQIARYLPETRTIHNPYGGEEQITLRHLLTHSSGLRSPTFPWRGDNDWAPHEPAEWSQIAAMMPYTGIEFAPGSRTQYSNLGSSMLGRVIEVVTGDNIEVYLTKNILMPLGMQRSYFDISPRYLLPHRSNNYYIRDGKPQAQGLDFDTGATVANGGLNAPLSDIARWTDFLLGLNDNGNYQYVLARSTLEEMWAPRLDMTGGGGEQWKMGYKFWSRPLGASPRSGSGRIIGHTGGQKAFTTFIYVVPEDGLALIYANNTINTDDRDTRHPLVDARETALSLLRPSLPPKDRNWSRP